MASIITFDGARSARLADEWSEDAGATPAWFGDAAYTFVSWGVLTFAVATGAMRAWKGLGLGKMWSSGPVSGARRRRRR